MKTKKWIKMYFGPEGEVAPPPPAAPPVKTFVQSDVDKIVQDRLSKANKEKEELLVKLQDAAKNETEKAAVTTQLEDLRAQMMTKEQQAAEALKKATIERESAVKVERERADKYKKTYESEKVKRELQDAATANKAHRPAQLVDLLSPKSRVIEQLGPDGKPTGDYEIRVKVQVQKDKKQVELDLTPGEAMKALKDDVDQYGNLFDSPMTGGLGASGPRTDGKNKSLEDMSQDEFNKRFQQDRTSLGLKRK